MRKLGIGCLALIGLAVVVVVVVVVVALAGIGGSSSTPGGGSKTVVYKIGGTAKRADMTFTTSSDGGNITQENGRRVPWSKSFKVKGSFLEVYSLSAQNKGSGKITCSVSVDGKRVAANTATGQYAIVTCDASK